MASKADRGSGGRAVVFAGGVAVAGLGLGLLSARPADRPTADIHSEYVKYPSGKDTLTAYIAYPERRDATPAVIVIHDIYGMSDRLRPAVELLAQRGFVAIGPGLLSRSGGSPANPDSTRRLNDARIDAGLQDLDTSIKRLRLDYRYRVYPGVGHAFLQTREKPDVADTAWAAIERFFRIQLDR